MTATALLRSLADTPDLASPMPALFIGHGSPMNAIEDTEFSRAWAKIAESLPRPRAVLCISAHWQSPGTRVAAAERPETIYDFFGFPRELYAQRYPAPGSPDLAQFTQQLVRRTPVDLDSHWGLDHGAWAVLCRMYPRADVPVVQLSLDERKVPTAHYDLGQELQALRRKGVLIVGSGNIVHNLSQVVWQDTAYDWALEFDERIKTLIQDGNHQAIIEYTRLGPAARLAVPTVEHYLPLLYVLGTRQKSEPLEFFADKVTLGSMSMRSVKVG